MSNDKDNRERDRKASGLLPEDVKQNLSDQKQEMLDLLRKEDRAFKRRKSATAMYWILTVISAVLLPLSKFLWSLKKIPVFQVLAMINFVSIYVLFVAAVVSTVSLLIRRRPVRDAQILAALHGIDETLQRLVRNHDKQ